MLPRLQNYKKKEKKKLKKKKPGGRLFKQFDKPRVQEGVSYSQFMDDAKNGKVKNVIVQGRKLTVTPADGQKYQIVSPGDIWMVGDLMKYGVQVSGKADDEPNAPPPTLCWRRPGRPSTERTVWWRASKWPTTRAPRCAAWRADAPPTQTSA